MKITRITRWILIIVLVTISYQHTYWSVTVSLFLIALILEVHIYQCYSRNRKVDDFILYLRGEYIKEKLNKVAEDALKKKHSLGE